MENQNAYLEQLKREMKDYQKNESKNNSGGSGRKTKEEILAKYFVPRNDQETFRILQPQVNSSKPIVEAYFHVVELNGPGGRKSKGKVIYCPAHNDPFVPKLDENGQPILDQEGKPVMIPAECPLCNKNKEMLKAQDNSIRGKKKDDLKTDAEKAIFEKNKEIFKKANEWAAKKFYIVRGIDKGKTKDGPKFWRFKKNFKNQGTFDRLIPVLNQFMTSYQSPYFDTEKGCDLSITMTEAEFNGRPYKTISAIMPNPPSKLHDDPVIAQQWVNDPTTWRDVFKKKSAPNVTPVEYLQMVANGTDPYWDDSDQNNKKWVFPGRPDLEEKANNRDRDLTAKEESYDNFKQASDLTTGIGISNVTEKNVGTFENAGQPNAVDATAGLETQKQEPVTTQQQQVETQQQPSGQAPVTETQEESYAGDEDYDDLPF